MHSIISPAQSSNPPLHELPSNVPHSHLHWAPAQTFTLSICLPELHLHGGSLKPKANFHSPVKFRLTAFNPEVQPAEIILYLDSLSGYRSLPILWSQEVTEWGLYVEPVIIHQFIVCYLRKISKVQEKLTCKTCAHHWMVPPRVSCDVPLVSFRRIIHLVFDLSLKKWIKTTVCCKMHRIGNRPHRVKCYFQ